METSNTQEFTIPKTVEHVEHVNKDGLWNLTDLDVIERDKIVIVYLDLMNSHGRVWDVPKGKEDQLIKELVNHWIHVLKTFNT